MNKKLCSSIICLVLFLVVARHIYQESSESQKYSGCIVVKKTMGESGQYIAINPNDLSESVLFDFGNYQSRLGKELIQPIFDNGNIYLIARDLKGKTPYSMVKISHGILESLPIYLPYSQKQDVSLFSLEDFFVFAVDENVFFISKKDYKLNKVYMERKEYTNVLPYRNGVIAISKNNEGVYLHDNKSEALFHIPLNYSFQGWFQMEENFLVYDKEAGKSIIINLAGEKIQVLGNQPYSVLGNQDKNGVLLEMLPKGSGGATILDFEYDWMDVMRSEHRYCLYPYIYNATTKSIRNLNMEVQFSYNSWQKMDFNKEYMEKIAESLN